MCSDWRMPGLPDLLPSGRWRGDPGARFPVKVGPIVHAD